jgi:sugar-specific transcriptional regulator TrmB
VLTENLIDKLKEMGFNSYEAKVYLALLKHHPATGYEISKDSGVPQARAYDTLKALEANHVVVSLGGKPLQYTPVNPEELLDRWERTYKSNIGYLRETLPSLSNETLEPVINLRGEESLLRHACELIDHAETSIFLELWQEDANRLQPRLQAAKARGVDIKVVGYNHCTLDGIEVFQHGMARTIETSLGGRWLILAVDEKEGMVGTVSMGDRSPQAVVTRNPGIVLIIKELIVHDIFLLDLELNLQTEIERVYGKGLMKLRRKILGNGVGVGSH